MTARAAIPGTAVALVPPPGFRPAAGFPGFEATELESSIAVTAVAMPVDALLPGMTAEALAARGITLTASEPIEVDGRAGWWIAGIEAAFTGAVAKWMVIAGTDDGGTVLVVGTAPVEAETLVGEPIRDALRSIAWTGDGGVTGDAADGLPFRFTPAEPLRVAARLGAVVLLTEHGAVRDDVPMMTLGLVPAREDDDLAAIATAHLEGIPQLGGLADVQGAPLTDRPGWELDAS
ncbi:MAG: hypothetical protein ABMB14_14610, partial [Myxococcota bacterium]